MTHEIPGDLSYKSDDSFWYNKSNENEFYIPTSNAGIYPFEIEKMMT